MANLDERISALENKLKQAKAMKQKQEARDRMKDRALDTRRKILVGAAVLARVQRGEMSETDLRSMLDVALTRADDRALFSL